MIGVVRRISRRTVLGILGTGLAAFTGVSTRQPDCNSVASTGDCDGALVLDGPETVSLNDGNPRFTLSTGGDASVTLAPDSWSVYRADDQWTHLESGDAGRTVTLDDERTVSYLLLVETNRSGPSVTTTETTTTRYVGPVSLNPGRYAFVISSHRDGSRTSVGARFDVTE